ncbi:MAG: hypothetical protein ACE5HT_09485 [Gemmatimonadales bacterium]
MGLTEQLQKIRDGSAERIPAESLAIMHRATENLRASGIVDRVLKVGDSLPPFELANANGEMVRSGDLLAKGPLVVTFFRGKW